MYDSRSWLGEMTASGFAILTLGNERQLLASNLAFFGKALLITDASMHHFDQAELPAPFSCQPNSD